MITTHGWTEPFIVFSQLWEHCRGLTIFTCLADEEEEGSKMDEDLTERDGGAHNCL